MKKPTEEARLRLNRFLARAGFGSRRSVEALIRTGVVAIDGRVVTDLATRVDPGRETVTVRGVRATLPRGFRIYAFHKPRGVVCTLSPQGDQTGLLAFRRQAGLPENLVPVGRLDADSSGLLLWTDDGDLAQSLCRPSSEVWKRYEARLDREPSAPEVSTLTDGKLIIDGRPCLPARLEPGRQPEIWTLELHEGRNRQIRRMFARLEIKVRRLHRLGVGPIRLGRLKEGGFRRLTVDEEKALRRAAGLA